MKLGLFPIAAAMIGVSVVASGLTAMAGEATRMMTAKSCQAPYEEKSTMCTISGTLMWSCDSALTCGEAKTADPKSFCLSSDGKPLEGEVQMSKASVVTSKNGTFCKDEMAVKNFPYAYGPKP
ncbi:MAG: hypothetical protein GC166_03275 [Alphaproteobacteria bacterium]|nr:hypothetical protein [Alphaproteobacteria bacterium]